VSLRAAVLSGLVTAALVLVAVWLFSLSFERAAVLAPVIVVIAGAIAGLVVLWARVGWESLRRHSHPWRVLTLALGALVVLAALSMLGFRLPHE
jgi:hypothetical protein